MGNQDAAALDVVETDWEVVKRLADGTVFEILEGGKYRPTICTFRDTSLTGWQSYMHDAPLGKSQLENPTNPTNTTNLTEGED